MPHQGVGTDVVRPRLVDHVGEPGGVDLDDESVGVAAESIAASPTVDLSSSTVKRFLYELAEDGVVERVSRPTPTRGAGRPPSRIEPLFPTMVFRRLYDRQFD